MSFHITIEAYNLKHVFSNLIVSEGGKSRASVFLTLVPLLIKTLILFLLSLNLLIRSFAAFGKQRVGRLWCQQRFFNKVIAEILVRKGLKLS